MRMTEAANEPVALARAGEQASGPGSVVSILVLDAAGLLRDGASPGLPADYLDAIDGLAGAWSMSITAGDGRVPGTFGTCFRECREPTPQECEAVSRLASVAAEVPGT